MNKKVNKSKMLSQNFLKDYKLVRRLINKSNITKKDLVIEIGPGQGIITKELAKQSQKVLAIEKDPVLVKKLKRNLKELKNVEILKGNALKFNYSQFRNYKIFSNIPFSIEGRLVRILLNLHYPPKDTYLIMRSTVAQRFAGESYTSQFNVINKPWFQFNILHYFNKEDFTPKPKVSAAMLHFHLRSTPLIPIEQKKDYEKFIKQGYGGGRRIRKNLSPFFTKDKLNKICQKIHINIHSKPSDLTTQNWISLFQEYVKQK
jgi:16S rRNA A1518/A1519 N6-dimethyltransferase RsmA/KsgA/DIM1 with predicted DNA glycosylase/AP lyase activity